MSPSTPSTYPSAPVPPPAWSSISAESIPKVVSSSIAESDKVLDSIVALAASERTFETVVRALAMRTAEMDREVEPSLFMQYVSTDKATRDASVEADKAINEWSLTAMTRKDVFEALLDAEKHTKEHSVKLNEEEERLLERLILERKRNGLGLDESKRKEYLELKKRIMTLEIDFQNACNSEDGAINFTKEELEGVPEDVVSGYPVVEENGVQKYKMTFKTPDYVPVVYVPSSIATTFFRTLRLTRLSSKYADVPETRKRANLGYEGKTLQNVPLMSEIVKLRHQAAQLLGYKNHAEWVLEVSSSCDVSLTLVKMAKNPESVTSFLADLESKLRPLGLAEREKLLKLKHEEHARRGLKQDDKNFWLWDYRYYDRLSVERELDLDDNLVKEYFPVSHVVPTVLGIYKDLLGVELIPVPRTEEAGGITWHEEAEMFAVWEEGKAGQDGAFLVSFPPSFVPSPSTPPLWFPALTFMLLIQGYLHLDLFPRSNKYGHAAVWGLIPGWTDQNGKRQYPVVAMVANLAKPTPTRPALMKHDDVVTFMHELGHAYHGLLSRTQVGPSWHFRWKSSLIRLRRIPTTVRQVPWTWNADILRRTSCHYQNKEPLSSDLIAKLIKSRNVNQGLFNLRQLFFGKYDMAVHTTEYNIGDEGMSKLWCDLREKISLVQVDEKDQVGGQSGFAHIAGGYSAGYYGYLYSQVFSADMFKTVFGADPMSRDAGMRYREKILRPGGSRLLPPSPLPPLRTLTKMAPKDPTSNPASNHALTVLQQVIPTLTLPPAPAVVDATWSIHSSFHGATHYQFQLPEGESVTDYERLERNLCSERPAHRLTDPLANQLAKACLVANATLSLLSTALGFPPQLRAASAQLHNLRANSGIQACMFEAYLATLHDEHGPAVLHAFVRAVYDPLLPVVVEALRPFHVNQAALSAQVNYVGLVMEWKAQRGVAAERRVEFVERESGAGTQARWTVDCTVCDSADPTLAHPKTLSGSASTVKKAKMEAAALVCQYIGLL
ncbi:SPOSA6832_03339 [Sporobolomyces salmonicolor]|uniref:SPOSA6832_03339-mRNA-1:cds n=1 Tax=Sporidiobolus salmonicolor TaxID=5005 RepID=A0A0D6EPS1_SPOSA|nr:SPOSA6832_03339 [Sporobolomyces salmonicolor]